MDDTNLPSPVDEALGVTPEASDEEVAAEAISQGIGGEQNPIGDGNGAGPGHDPRTVPLAALHEERERRRELLAQLQAEAERRTQIEARFEELARRAEGGDPIAPEAAQGGDPYERARREVESRMALERAQLQEFVSTYQARSLDFAREQPDYWKAYKFLMRDREEELVALGYTDPRERNAIAFVEEQSIAAKAMKEGLNPAARIYAIAKRRGYGRGGAGGAQALAALRNGASAARSLGAVNGAAEPNLSLEALAEMSDEDFDRNWDRVMARARGKRSML